MKNKKFIILLLCMLAFLSLMPMQASAAGAIDTTRDVSLCIEYMEDGKALEGAVFDLYYLASTNAYAEYALTGDFAGYRVSLDGLDAEGWSTLAFTLKGFVQRDKLTPLDSGSIDATGKCRFPNEGVTMKPGLYLLLGQPLVIGRYTYRANPTLVFIPGIDNEANDWVYDLTAAPKREKDYDDTVIRKVLKVWEDKGNEAKRPKEIQVQLLKDGEVYETVTLNAGNNWRYQWDKLSEKYDWTLVEKETSGYNVKVELEGVTFVVTNTYDGTSNPPGGGSGGKLPQTGVLWWPVPLLTVAGLTLLAMGLLCRKRNGYE